MIDEVVWVVGDEAILKSDVENERLNAQYEGRKFDGDPYCIIPEQLAIQKLFLHQAAIDSIEVSEQEIISDVERRTNWLIDQIGSKEKVEEYYNKTSTQIREMLRENIRDGKTVQKMQQQIVGDIKITPAEVRRYFKDLPQDSIPFIPTQGRKCSTDTSVVCNVEVFVQGYIEVHANECLFTGKIEIVKCLHITIILKHVFVFCLSANLQNKSVYFL